MISSKVEAFDVKSKGNLSFHPEPPLPSVGFQKQKIDNKYQ